MPSKAAKTEDAEVVSRETADAVEPGKPVEAQAVTQMGATFAERAGKKAPAQAKQANSTFAERAKASGKAVSSDEAEDKSVKSAQAKGKG